MKRKIVTIFGSVIVIVALCWLFFSSALRDINKDKQLAIDIVTQEQLLSTVSYVYVWHLDDTVYTVVGQDAQGADLYVMINMDKQVATVYTPLDFLNEEAVLEKSQQIVNNITVLKSTIGEKDNRVVWEVVYKSDGEALGYIYLDAKTGELIQHIATTG